jgi:hypothetical protein
MKAHLLFLAGLVAALFLTPTAGWTQDKYAPTANEAFYGAWANENVFPPRMVESPDGTFSEYFPGTNPKPFRGGTAEIEKKWTGSDGSTCCYVVYLTVFGANKGTRIAWLCRINESGNALEMMWRNVGLTFDPAKMPTEIDPKDANYRVFARADD